ncbi:hypothetical protein Bca101_017932 [Brassica carinata]
MESGAVSSPGFRQSLKLYAYHLELSNELTSKGIQEEGFVAVVFVFEFTEGNLTTVRKCQAVEIPTGATDASALSGYTDESLSHRDVVERDPTFDLMDAFSAFMSNRENRGRGISSGPENFPGLAPLLIFGGQVPYRLSGDNAFEALFSGGSPGIGIRRGNTGDYFFGPGLEELFEQLSAGTTTRRGPPPAPRSSIDALPTIKIAQRHLRSSDSNCPVCKDEFELGAESKQMPCNQKDFGLAPCF